MKARVAELVNGSNCRKFILALAEKCKAADVEKRLAFLTSAPQISVLVDYFV